MDAGQEGKHVGAKGEGPFGSCGCVEDRMARVVGAIFALSVIAEQGCGQDPQKAYNRLWYELARKVAAGDGTLVRVFQTDGSDRLGVRLDPESMATVRAVITLELTRAFDLLEARVRAHAEANAGGGL